MDYYCEDIYFEYDSDLDCVFKCILLVSFDGKDSFVEKEIAIDDDEDEISVWNWHIYDSRFDCLFVDNTVCDENGEPKAIMRTVDCSPFEMRNFPMFVS